MKQMKMDSRIKHIFMLAIIVSLIWLRPPMPSEALTVLPDIGINYQTITVKDAAKMKAAGMKSAVNGDKLTMRFSEKGVMILQNQRTLEMITYPHKK